MSAVVLHVVESFGAGVAYALTRYVDSTPELEHHLLKASRRERVSPSELDRFATVSVFPRGLSSIGALRRAIQRVRPDVIHAHSSWAGAIARLGTPRGGPRIVYTPHCFAFERTDVHVGLRALFWAAEWVFAQRTDAVLACSSREAELGRTLGVSTVVHVPNVADIDSLLPAAMANRGSEASLTEAPSGPAASSPRSAADGVVMVGRLAPQKDPDFFIEVARLVWETRPNTRFTWIGDGDVERRQRLESAGITVTGWLDHSATAVALAEASVYVHSAAWEGFPISLLEAHAAGLAVVARRISALRDLPAESLANAPRQLAMIVVARLDAREVDWGRHYRAMSVALGENTAAVQRSRLLESYAVGPRYSRSRAPTLVAPKLGAEY